MPAAGATGVGVYGESECTSVILLENIKLAYPPSRIRGLGTTSRSTGATVCLGQRQGSAVSASCQPCGPETVGALGSGIGCC